MQVLQELEQLERKAIAIAAMPDRKMRQKGGLMLEAECRSLDNQYRITGGLNHQAEVSLGAVLKIIFDYILYDALEDEDWVGVLPDHFEGDIEAEMQEIKRNAS